MKFSLVMATLGRFEEIKIFLNSLLKQSYNNFELIIIDQNDDNRIEQLCLSYSMNINVVKNTVKGLSANRNIGLKYVTGDIVAFPDDDCEYEANTLENIVLFFKNNPMYGFYTCNTKEKTGELSILAKKTDNTVITKNNVMHVGISFTIFIKTKLIENFLFDEQLGIGAEFGSGEESDLLFYLLKNGNKGYYHSKHYIYHPYKQDTTEKAFQYGKGYGAVHKKAFLKYKFINILFLFFFTMFKELFKIIFYKYSSQRIFTFKGRLFGFNHYR